MKKPSTFTLDEEVISYLNEIAKFHKRSKSSMLEILINNEYKLIKKKNNNKNKNE